MYLNKVCSCLYQVKKLVYQSIGGGKGSSSSSVLMEAVGFVPMQGGGGGRERRFNGGPVRLTDVPVDHFLAAVHQR